MSSSFSPFLNSHHFLTELLNIMYSNTTSEFVSTIYIVISFFQIAGYIFKLNYTEITDSKMSFVLQVFYFSNFWNLLDYFSNEILTYVAFYFWVIFLHLMIFFPFITTILKKSLKLKLSDNPVYKITNFVFRKFFESFFWILMTPTMEFGMNITDCESFSYIVINRDNAGCIIPVYVWFLAIWLCVLSFIIATVYMWTYTENSFLDTKSIKMNFTFCYFLVFFSRFIFILVFPLIYNESGNLVYVFLHIFALTGFIDYWLYFPIRNHEINKKYISVLCAMEAFFVVMTFWGIWGVISQDNLFYVMIIMMVFGYKFGEKLHFALYFKILNSNFRNEKCKTYLLEELLFLHQNIKLAEKNMIFCGICRHHVKDCRELKCKLMEKHLKLLESTNNEDERRKIINDFILQTFQNTILEISKPGNLNHPLLESFLMKYTSFLTCFNANPLKAFFEIQKIMKKHGNASFLFKCFKSVLIKATKKNILTKDREKQFSQKNSENMDKELEVNLFLEILKEKTSFELNAMQVLKAKIHFWEKYKDGIGSYEEIMREISSLTRKIGDFRSQLEELLKKSINKSRPLFAYKFLSFLYSILLNDINEGMKMEDEVESTKKREFSHEHNILSYISFFQDNMIPIKVSFLSTKGQILEESKNPKLAEFFNYSKEDLKSLNLNDLMPNYIAQYHDRFFLWHLNKPRKLINANSRKFIDTYAKKKSGLVFPINIYVGYGFEYKEDFVLQGLICEESSIENTSKSLLFNETGRIQGMDMGFCNLLTDNKIEIKPNDLVLLNLFNLMPSLMEIIEKNEGFKKRSLVIRNQISMFNFPKNINEIIEILRIKHKEEVEFTNKMSYYSGHTSRTKKSSNNQSKNQSNRSLHDESEKLKGNHKLQYLTKLFTSKPQISIKKRSELEEKSFTHKLDDKDILTELVEKSNCIRFRAYFDLKVHCYEFGEKEDQKLPLFSLKINKLRIVLPNNSMTYRDTSKISLSISQNIMFPEDKEQPLSDVESGFIHMPPENIASFRHEHHNILEDIESNVRTLEREEEKFQEKSINNENSMSESPKIEISSIEIKEKHNNLATDANLITLENKDFLSVRLEKPNEEIKKTIEENKDDTPRESQDEDQENKENLKEIIANPDNANKNTTDKVFMKENDKFSGKASSISTIKKAFSIFNSIQSIQKYSPLTIIRLILAFSIELLFIIIFCILIYQFAMQYMNNYYNPLKTALEDFTLLTTSWCSMCTAATEFELYRKNFTYFAVNSFQSQQIYEIFNQSFTNTKELLNYERNLETRFAYQTIFKERNIRYTDTTFYQTSFMNFLDIMDLMIGAMNELIMEDQMTMNIKTLEEFPLNFQYIVDVYNDCQDAMKEEFLNSNVGTSQNVLTVMLIFVIVLVPLKLFELREITMFFQNLVKMLNIFLRVNQKSACNEYLFQKEILENVFNKDKKELLFVYFPEKTINKKYFDVPSITENINEKNSPIKKKIKNDPKKSNKNQHKFSFHNLKPISLFRPKLLLLSLFILLFSYFFFIYLEWTIVDANINTLIAIHNYFFNFYGIPAHVLTLDMLMYREKIVTIPELLATNEPTQTKAFREASVISELSDHLVQFETESSEFPIYLFQVSDAINSNALNILITSDVCSQLYAGGIIEEDGYQACELLMNNAFQQGIIAVMDQLLNTDKIQQDMVIIETDAADIASQLVNIRNYIASSDNMDLVITEHLFEETNLIIFTLLIDYYTQLIVNEINNLEIMILVFTIMVGIIIIVFMEYYRRSLKRIYREMSFCLSLIPYERLINDEQTVFLIKKFGNV